MNDLMEIKETAELLSNSFRTVVINGDGSITAKDHFPLALQTSCEHRVKITARHIFACIANGHLTGNKQAAMKYDKVEYCQKCETVFSAELDV